MKRIGVRELRQNASKYLADVESGESIEITDRGRPVARLVPVSGDPWQDLVNAGDVVLASCSSKAGDIGRIGPETYPHSASEALERLRRDER
jgi:prevent-host-death family protein